MNRCAKHPDGGEGKLSQHIDLYNGVIKSYIGEHISFHGEAPPPGRGAGPAQQPAARDGAGAPRPTALTRQL